MVRKVTYLGRILDLLQDNTVWSFQELQTGLGDAVGGPTDYVIKALKKGIAERTIVREANPDPRVKTLYVGHSYRVA